MSKNVYVCQFSLDRVEQYDMKASVKDSGFTYPDLKGILRSRLEEENDEIISKKKEYSPLALELERTNHFFMQSKIVPNALWIGVEKDEIKLPTNQDYIFSIWNGGRIFNQTCATILKKHRLGETILTPVQIYDLSIGDLVSDETYYFLNLYERRTYIRNPQSDTRVFRKVFNVYRDDLYMAYDFIKDQKLEVDNSALACDVDLWFDDRLGSYFFISDDLYQALSQAGMIDKFNPHTCNLIR